MQQLLQHSFMAVTEQGVRACEGVAAAGGDCGTGSSLTDALARGANTLIFVVGALAVIMVIIGGLRYVLSGGDAAGIKGAKDTIMYALIGVAVAGMAYALVSFVITRLG